MNITFEVSDFCAENPNVQKITSKIKIILNKPTNHIEIP